VAVVAVVAHHPGLVGCGLEGALEGPADAAPEIAAISKIEEQEVAIKDEGEMIDEANDIYKDADDQPDDSNHQQ